MPSISASIEAKAKLAKTANAEIILRIKEFITKYSFQ